MPVPPLISICLPTLNAREFLVSRIDSILAQTYSNWELIVCDSYSDDGTWEYLSALSADLRVRLHRVPKEGLYAGWNECLRRVRGEYVYIATADDTMSPNCLERLVAPMEVHTDVDMVVSEADQINIHGLPEPRPQPRIWKFLSNYHQGAPTRISRDAFFLMLTAFPQGIGSVTGIMFRHRLLEKSGLFPTDLSYLGDAEWALRAALATDVIAIPDRLATWRIRPGQASKAFDLGAALIFRSALDRVLDDSACDIPAHWPLIPQWRERLRAPRTWAAVEFSGLLRLNLRRRLKQFPGFLLNTWRKDRGLFWERVLSGFTYPQGLRDGHEKTTLKMLGEFKASWPPTSTSGK